MSMTNEELCGLKVDIQTNNLLRYREIAILVDKPKFLEKVKEIRKKIGIEALLPFKSGNWWTASVKWAKEFPQKDRALMSSSRRICREFKRPIYMVNDIYQAILFGKILEGRVAVGIVHPKTIVERAYVAIFPTPYTTHEDIKKALDTAKKTIKEDSLFSMPFDFRAKNPKHTAFSGIVEHRELYWRNIAGESYTDIALSMCSDEEQAEYKKRKANKEHPSRDAISHRPYVAQSIRRYKKALATE